MADYVSLTVQRGLDLVLPPLPVQRRIADILGALDDKIELNRRMNETLEEMAQALYRHWFVDFGAFQDREFRDTEELGPIPKGWEVGKLNDYCTVNRQTVNKDDPPNPIEYIKISGVNEGRVEETEEMPWDESPTRANRRVKDGDIVWSKVRPNREGYFLCLEPPENLVVSTGFATITPNRVPFSWVYLSLTTDDFVEHLTARATGAAYPSVTLDAFRDAEFAIPDNATLEAFHDKVEPLFRLQRSNTAENETLAETRDYLLPKLISGEIEVDAAEKAIETNV
jgi:type I restriction enzyme S subunit